MRIYNINTKITDDSKLKELPKYCKEEKNKIYSCFKI